MKKKDVKKEPKNNNTILTILTIVFVLIFGLGILEKNRVMSLAGIVLIIIVLFYWTGFYNRR